MRKELIFREKGNKYYRVPLCLNKADNKSRINVDFDNLLFFIGQHKPCENKSEIGSAYAIIREKTNELLGVSKKDLIRRTSKKEISSIRFFYKNYNIQKNENFPYIAKIPFKLEYIFRAIIMILEEIEAEGNCIPSNLEHLVNKTYKMAFYREQKEAYEDRYKTIPEEYETQRAIKDDFDEPNSPLNKKFH